MLLILGSLLVFGAIVALVLALQPQNEGLLSARMAALRGERRMDFSAMTERESIGSRVIGPMASSMVSKLEALLPSRWLEDIDKSLLKAGEPVTRSGFLFAAVLAEAATVGIAFTLSTAGGAAPGMMLLLMGCGAGVGVLLPKMWLGNRVRYRQKAILKSLPDAFDLITVCVEAGLGLDASLAKVAEKVEGPFGEELAICLREVSLGKLRREALKELADRSGVADLTTFINAVIQAETMGTSIAAVLRVQAEQMRMRRRQRAEQQAQAAPIKMMFPLVFCIFPTLFIVILGPAGMTLYRELVAR